jgi:hypothetical protein
MPDSIPASGPVGGGLARDHAGDDIRRNAIVGHRLAGGYMSVHAPGQPCGLCDGGPAMYAVRRGSTH